MTQDDRPKKGEPGYKEWLSDVRRKAAKKAYHDNPELKNTRRKQMKARYKDPEEVEKTRQQQLERWSDPEECEKQSQRQLDFIEDNPEITELRTKASQEYWSDEEAREKRSNEVQTRWQDDEFREKQHQARLGNTNAKGNRGKPKSEEHKRKIGDAHRGRKLSPEHIEKIRVAKTGIKRGTLVCLACSKPFPRDEITRNDGFCDVCSTHTKLCDCECGEEMFKYKKNGDIQKYLDNSHSSLHYWARNPEYKKAAVERMSGENHHNWQGGIQYEPYDNRWTPEFREEMRTRQNHICADNDDTCNAGERALHVHHIDGDKLRSVPENCVALCNSHHMRSRTEEDKIRYELFVKALMK